MELDHAQIRALVAKAQNGDTDAFGQIYDHFFDQVYRFSAFRVPQDIAEDLTADIFVKAWEKIHTYKLRKNVPFGAWLFRIARNMVVDAYRGQKIIEEVPDTLEDHDRLNAADTRVKSKETVVIVRKAMEKLPKRYQDILSLSFLADLPHDEIARILRISEGSVRILKFRALKKLEEFLPPDFEESA